MFKRKITIPTSLKCYIRLLPNIFWPFIPYSFQVSELKARQEGSEEEIKFIDGLKRDLEEENDGLKTKVIKLEQKLKVSACNFILVFVLYGFMI